MDNSFTKAVVQVPHLSGFDKSHQNLFTSKCGTITPILIDELIPGSKVHLKLALSAQLPPLAVDTFMRCSVKVEAFLVPFRLLAGSFESWFTDQGVKFQDSYSTVASFSEKVGFLPCIGAFDTADADITTLRTAFLSAGSLADYLGLKGGWQTTMLDGPTIGNNIISAMPFLCYHKVYDDWYRSSLVQNEVFIRPQLTTSSGVSPTSSALSAATSPYYFFSEILNSANQNYIFNSIDRLKLADGVKLYELRQRNFGFDYFTTATPTPQLGSAQSVSFATSGATGSFTIAALRAANSLQQFAERNNLAGSRYVDQLRARYGANLSNGIAQRSIFLGAGDFEVYTKGVYQSTPAQTGATPGNPFDTVGSRYGSAYAQGSDFVVSCDVDEPCYLLVNATLVPRVTYSTGIHRRLRHYLGAGSLVDLANPLLQNVGPQPIRVQELVGSQNVSVFGYTDRYAEFKTMEDELHGLVRDGESMASFALQRSFSYGGSPVISNAFLQIPTTYMDQVTAVASDMSTYGYWADVFFDYKVVQPLAKYSLPSLQDPAYEHGKSVVVDKGGFRL